MAATSEFWVLKKQFETQFGENGKAVFGTFFNHIIDPRHWGYWRQDAYGEGQRHGNTEADFDRGWAKRLTKSRLYRHFLARQKIEYAYYVSSFANVLNNERLVVPMFDIDDKTASGQSALIFERLRKALPMVPFYSCPSTSGWGIHAYACISFPARWSRRQLSGALGELSHHLQRIVNDGSLAATFDRITATPWYRADDDKLVRGTLGKVPSALTATDMQNLHSVLLHSTSWSVIETELGIAAAETDLGEQASAAPLAPSVTSAGVSYCKKSNRSLEQVEGERGDTEQLAGSSCFAQSIKTLPPRNIHALMAQTETLARRQGFALKLCRQEGQPLPATTLMERYEASGLATGPRTAAREANFKQIAEYIAATFDSSKLRGFKNCLDSARRHLDSLLTDAVVSQMYGRQINRSLLTKEDVSVVYAMYLTFSARKKNVAIARNAAHSFSQALKEEGLIKNVIDHKRFAAAKRILQDLGLIRLKYKARKGSNATAFVVIPPSEVVEPHTGQNQPPECDMEQS